MRSPKSVLKASTPWPSSRRNLLWYHLVASGLVKSTMPIPACQRSDCQTSPLGFLTRWPDALGVREGTRIPLEVAPVELAHPEAVEVEDRQRQVALGHRVDETGDGLLVVVRGEAGREPQAVGPGGDGSRTAGQRRVPLEDLFGRRPVDDEVLKALPGNGELHALNGLRADLVGDVARMVDQHAIAAVRQVERDVLVGLLARGAAVCVPDVHDLAVLHQRRTHRK